MKNNTAQKNIPKGWKYDELGTFIAEIADGGTPSRSNTNYFGGDIPWVVVNDIRKDINKTKETLTEDGLNNSSAKVWPAGTVILSFGATIGEVGIANVPLTTKQGIAGIIPKDELLNTYLYYLLLKNKNRLKQLSSGSTIKEVRPAVIKKQIKVLIPPIYEQQKIAEILGSVDEDILKTQGVIEVTEKLKKGLMQELFAKSKNNNWKIVKMKDICKVRQGLQIPIKKRFKDSGSSRFVYITLKYLKELENTEYIENPKQSVICKKDDILMTRTGNTGIVVTGVSGVFHNNFFLIDFNRKRIDKDFLVYYLRSSVIQKIILDKAGTTTIPDLNHGDFYSIDFIMPSLKEQKKIAEILSAVDEKISVNKKLKSKLIQLKKGLAQDLLSGKVRVVG